MRDSDEINRLTSSSLMKTLYIALQYPLASEAEMLAVVPEHLEYMKLHEDKLFLSGPLVEEGRIVADGLTILKTEDEAEARAFMDAEPLIKKGLRRYDLRLWRIQEGSLTISISGFHGSAAIG